MIADMKKTGKRKNYKTITPFLLETDVQKNPPIKTG